MAGSKANQLDAILETDLDHGTKFNADVTTFSPHVITEQVRTPINV